MKKNIGKIEIQEVTGRHRTTCRDCGEVPEVRRLKVSTGSGKWVKSLVFCGPCGREWIRRLAFDLQKMDRRLE